MSAVYALIPAAGRSVRFRSAEAQSGESSKLFAALQGRPLLRWTVEAFASHEQIDGIVVVTSSAELARCRETLVGIEKLMAILPGGETRQDSVSIGLYGLGSEPNALVLVHDGARPLVTADMIDRCIAGARRNGSAVAAVSVVDTLKSAQADGSVTGTIDRAGLWAIQTPQAFRLETLMRAHIEARGAGFVGTDEASLVERLEGETVHLVPGASTNLKVTHPEDLAVAAALLQSRQGSAPPEVRIGFGYDIHRLTDGRQLFLGGVEIASPDGRGLDGHSDADVLLHAICDALLGAAALPDIGTLFPNTDAAYAGISSAKLLAEVGFRVESLGYRLINLDSTVIAEMPKIGPYIPQMRQTIAEILGVAPMQIGIKATTNEGLGALGHSEGIAAHAVASLAAK